MQNCSPHQNQDGDKQEPGHGTDTTPIKLWGEARGGEKRRAGAKGFHLVPATFLGSKAVDRRALLAGVRSSIHMPAIRYSMVSSWLVRPITSASIARQLLSKAAAYTSNKLDF